MGILYISFQFNWATSSDNAGFSSNNLPIGMQIISKTNREIDILNLAKHFEDNFVDLNKKPEI